MKITEKNNRNKINSARGMTDIHPTQLRRGGGAGIAPEKLNIIKTKSEQSAYGGEPHFVNPDFDGGNVRRQPAKAEAVREVRDEIKSVPVNKSAEYEKKARRFVNTVLCTVSAVVIAVGSSFAVINMTDEHKPTYSEYEKRNLEQAPELTVEKLADGSYTEDFDRFFSDNFPFRESIVKRATVLKRFRGIRAFNKDAKQVIRGDSDMYTDGEMEIIIDAEKFNDGREIVIPGLSDASPVNGEETESPEVPADGAESENGGTVPAFSNTEIPASTEITETAEPEVQPVRSETQTQNTEENTAPKGEKRDTIYIIGDTAFEYFRGSEKSSSDYINVVNTYAKYIPENVNIYTLVIPTHPEFGLTGADRKVSNDQKPVIEHIGNSLDARVKFVNPYARLADGYKKGEYLYFRTDHHWTVRGAYKAYLEFCAVSGIQPIPEENYEKGRVEPFLGTFYGASGREQALGKNPDFVEYFMIDIPCTVTRYDKSNNATVGKLYYKSVRGESNAYLAFMGGDFPYINIKTENTNGRKLMIFKESFGNPLIGLLVPHFEEVHVADIRYFKYNSVNFIKQYGITDVLFCNGIMSANSKARVNDLLNLMNK